MEPGHDSLPKIGDKSKVCWAKKQERFQKPLTIFIFICVLHLVSVPIWSPINYPIVMKTSMFFFTIERYSKKLMRGQWGCCLSIFFLIMCSSIFFLWSSFKKLSSMYLFSSFKVLSPLFHWEKYHALFQSDAIQIDQELKFFFCTH